MPKWTGILIDLNPISMAAPRSGTDERHGNHACDHDRNRGLRGDYRYFRSTYAVSVPNQNER